MANETGLTRDQLTALINSGDIDTVVMAFPDLFGRLVGKRTTGRFFLDHVAEHGTENCDYLIACDIENNPVPGFRFASYDQGYGDMVARADWNAARVVPWYKKGLACALKSSQLCAVGFDLEVEWPWIARTATTYLGSSLRRSSKMSEGGKTWQLWRKQPSVLFDPQQNRMPIRHRTSSTNSPNEK